MQTGREPLSQNHNYKNCKKLRATYTAMRNTHNGNLNYIMVLTEHNSTVNTKLPTCNITVFICSGYEHKPIMARQQTAGESSSHLLHKGPLYYWPSTDACLQRGGGSLLHVFPPKPCTHFIHISCTKHVHPVLSDLSPQQYPLDSTNHAAPHYTVSSIFLLLPTCEKAPNTLLTIFTVYNFTLLAMKAQ
jgi:hypothetical protein